jgi:GGDEF domain-containing protein
MRDERLRRGLLLLSALSGGLVFASFVLWERPGLGIGHFYYVCIMLAALATGPIAGATAATVATGLFAAGLLINPHIPSSEVLTTSTGIRLLTYMTVGVVTGYFAKRTRVLMAELELLAERDALTGLPNTRAFERAIGDRLARDGSFGLLVGAVDSFHPGDEVARVGDDEFAVLTYACSASDAGKVAAQLQRVLADDGFAVTFGWAAYPQDGSNALSLYRAADERLYARRVIHRQASVIPLPEPASADGLA